MTRWLLLTAALLGATALPGGAQTAPGANRLQVAKVYTVPGADAEFARPLPGGRWAVSADNAVLVLDASLKVVRGWYTLQGPVRGLAVSPDGSRVAALTGAGGRWAVWDANTGAQLDSGNAYSTSIGFDAENNLLVRYQDTVLRNRLGTDPGRFTALDLGVDVRAFEAAPDGKTAVVEDDTSLRLVDLGSGETLARAELSEDPEGLRVTFAPDGQAAVAQTGAETLLLRAGEDEGRVVPGGADLSLEDAAVYYVSAQEFVTVVDGKAQRHSAQTGERLGAPQDTDLAAPVVGTPGGAYLALGRGVAPYSPATRTEGKAVSLSSANAWLGGFLTGGVPAAGVDAIARLDTGRALNLGAARFWATESQGGKLWLLGAGTKLSVYAGGKLRALATLDEDAEYDQLSLSPDGRFLVASGYYGMALLNAQTGAPIARVSEEVLDVEDIHYALPTQDGKGMVYVPHEGGVYRYDPRARRSTRLFAAPEDSETLEIRQSPGGTLAVGYEDDAGDQHVALLRPGQTRAAHTLEVPGRLRALRFSPDGKTLAVLSDADEGALALYDTASGQELARTGRFHMTTSLLSWSPAGDALMVGAGQSGQAGSVTVYRVRR